MGMKASERDTRRLKSSKCKFSILISSAGLYFGPRRNTFTPSKKLYLKAPVDWLADIVHSRFAKAHLRALASNKPRWEKHAAKTRKKAWMGDSITLTNSEIKRYYANTERAMNRIKIDIQISVHV